MKQPILNPKLKRNEDLKTSLNRLMASDDGRVLMSHLRDITGWDRANIVKGPEGILEKETLELAAKKEIFRDLISHLNREYYYLAYEKEL